MLLSVLIPVYNAEAYLDACVQSVLAQSERDFEIVLCDDGSSDGCAALCGAYAARYPGRVRALRNERNEGQLLTRRRLFAAADGQYLLCVDADDQLEPDALRQIRMAIEKTHADMIVFNAVCVRQNGTAEQIQPALRGDCLYWGESKAACFAALFENNALNSLCTKAFKRSLLDFSTDYTPWRGVVLGEDRFQSLPLFDRAATVYYLDQSLYRYYKREGSVTGRTRADYYAMRKLLWEREDAYLAVWRTDAETGRKSARIRCHEILNYAARLAAAQPFSVFSKEMEQIRRDGIFSRARKAARLTGRYRWYGLCLQKRLDAALYAAMRGERNLVRLKGKI